MSIEVSTPDLLQPLPRIFGNGGAAGGEAEAWHLSGTGKGGAEGQEGTLSASGAVVPLPQEPVGANSAFALEGTEVEVRMGAESPLSQMMGVGSAA